MAYKSQPAVIRPANTTAYTANDVVGGVIEFKGLGIPSNLMLTSADLRIDTTAIPTGMTSFRLYMYKVTPPSALADNAAWDLPAGDRAAYLGYIDIGSPVDLGSTLFCQVDQINKQIQSANTETSIYGYLVTNGGFTPAANSEVYTPTIHAVDL